MTGSEALVLAIRRLKEAGNDSAPTDARRLLAHALGIDPGRVSMILPDPLPAPDAYFRLVDRRAAHEPVSRIIGKRAFWGRDFTVTPDVLDPRPETERLVEAALAEPFASVLDLGTGSGCILLTLLAECPRATGLGTDASAAALLTARINAAQLGLSGRAGFAAGSWWQPVRGRFDLIVSNPPYIAPEEMADLSADVRRHDPEDALTDHLDGLSAYRAILEQVRAHLEPGGRLIVEIGWRQGPAVRELFLGAGLDAVTVLTDLEGRDRVVSGRNPA